jgi:hypothetical protein
MVCKIFVTTGSIPCLYFSLVHRIFVGVLELLRIFSYNIPLDHGTGFVIHVDSFDPDSIGSDLIFFFL